MRSVRKERLRDWLLKKMSAEYGRKEGRNRLGFRKRRANACEKS
jgi:hypothetical protein